MARGLVQISKDLRSPATPGVYYRLIGLTGQNKGTCYYLKGSRAVIGRGDQADIQIFDSKASREHAELTKVKQDFVVTDLGSQNGIVVNDLKVTQHRLTDNDRIIIGQTIFKFQILKVETAREEKKTTQEEETFEEEEFQEPKVGQEPRSLKKLLILGAVIAVGLLVFMMDTPTAPKKPEDVKTGKADSKETEGNLFRKKPGTSAEDKENEEKIRGLVQQGQRELREGNYFRAIAAFQLATNLDPQNGYAQFYLNKSKQALDDEVKLNFFRAAQDVEALKYRSAIVSYCAVMRLLQAYPEDQRYKEAQANIEFTEQRLGMEKGETKCFESK